MILFSKELPSDVLFDLHIVTGPHVESLDARLLTLNLGDADIFIPEMMFWNPKTAEIFEEVSSGKLQPREACTKAGISETTDPFYGFLFTQFTSLATSSRKPEIVFIDFPADNATAKEAREHVSSLNPQSGLRAVFDYDFVEKANVISSVEASVSTDEFIDQTNQFCLEMARFNELREEYMLQQLHQLQEGVVAGGKKKKVVLFVGLVHARALKNGFASGGKNTRVETKSLCLSQEDILDPYSYLIYLHRTQGKPIYRIVDGKPIGSEVTETDILGASMQLMLQPIIGDYLRNKSVDTRQVSIIYKFLAKDISRQKIVELQNLLLSFSRITHELAIRKIFEFFNIGFPERTDDFINMTRSFAEQLGIRDFI